MNSLHGMIITGMVFLIVAVTAPSAIDAAPAALAGGQSQITDPAPTTDPASIPGSTRDGTGQPAPMTDIHDIKPLVTVTVPVSLATVLLWSGVCLLIAASVLGVWLLWKRRRSVPLETLEAILSPEDAAFQRLSALSADTMGGKAFYFQLSAVFRQYLQDRFGIDGLEMTTEELLPHVETMPLERDLKREVRSFLVFCDPVKFAEAPTHRETMEQDLGFVRGFVEKTASPLSTPELSGEPGAQDASEVLHRVPV